MTTTLLLKLAAPLQSWGSSSRFARRTTDAQPTKSGVIGLMAAAMGRRRTDPIEDLLGLRFGVRVDQPGELIRDFQTARSFDGATSMPLSDRYYRSDAVFLAAVEGEDMLISSLDQALRHPYFPLFLGRRSCPPVGRVTLGVQSGDLESVLRAWPWEAARWWQSRHSATEVDLTIMIDAEHAGDSVVAVGQVKDSPVSFDPRHRRHGLRQVATLPPVRVVNPFPSPERGHQPFGPVGTL